jgi:hypothetical protein
MNKKIPILIIIILLIAVAYAVMLDLKEAKNMNIEEESIVEENNEENNVNDKCVGYISGVLEFNSGPIKIPEKIYICARDLETKENYCTSEIIKDYNFSGKDGYKLVVSGDRSYQVAGMFPSSVNLATPLKEWSYSTYCSDIECKGKLHPFRVDCDEYKENIDLNYGHPAVLFEDFDVYSINK